MRKGLPSRYEEAKGSPRGGPAVVAVAVAFAVAFPVAVMVFPAVALPITLALTIALTVALPAPNRAGQEKPQKVHQPHDALSFYQKNSINTTVRLLCCISHFICVDRPFAVAVTVTVTIAIAIVAVRAAWVTVVGRVAAGVARRGTIATMPI